MYDAIDDVQMPINSLYVLTFPEIYEFDGDTVSTSITLISGPSPIAFISSTSDIQIFDLNPTLITQVGVYSLNLRMSDGYEYEDIIFSLEITN